MAHIDLRKNGGYKWISNGSVFVKGTALHADNQLLSGENLLQYFEQFGSEEDFVMSLQSLNGLFSVIISTASGLMAAVDRNRNFPLLYNIDNGFFKISDDYRSFLDEKTEIDTESEIGMIHIGWVPGKRTLIKDVFQIQSGEYLVFTGNKIETKYWYQSEPCTSAALSRGEWKAKIKECFYTIGKRMCLQLDQRPVALPLSGGYDSRLIGLLLKMNAYDNVFCFTFGDKDSQEIANSQEIAKRLGYSWKFIDYEPYIGKDFDEVFEDYAQYAGNAMSFPYLQEFYAVKTLKEIMNVSRDTVILPGHSGDTIGGSAYFPDLKSFKSIKDFCNKIRRIYCRYIVSNKDYQKVLYQLIEETVDSERLKSGCLAYTDWDIRELQSKQLVNSAKIFDFFGYTYLLPLSDKDFSELFYSMPLKNRVFKNMYDETVKELFVEHGILLEDEVSHTQLYRKKMYYQMRLREFFLFIPSLKRKKNKLHFFQFTELIQPLKKNIPPFKYKQPNGILSAWYAEEVKKTLLNQKQALSQTEA